MDDIGKRPRATIRPPHGVGRDRSPLPSHDRKAAAVQSPTELAVSAEPRPVINLYQPDLSGNERRYVLECLDSSWISSNGVFVPRFEQAFAEVVGAAHAVAVSNGTVALHLALHALGIGPGDEVIVPSFTYIASVNAIAQTGATPVLADSRLDDWLLDPDDVQRRITPRTRAIREERRRARRSAASRALGARQLKPNYNSFAVNPTMSSL
jgi:hypothetical protein